MAAAEDIGANFSDYQGNANLGGGNFGVISVDTRPLDQLSLYTFTYNRAKYEEAQKDAVEKATQLANLTAYDLTTAIPEDRKKIQKGYDELYKYVQDNPTVLDYKNNQKGWMEYNKKKNDFENKLRGAKTRNIMYMSRDEEASNATTVEEKRRLKEDLDNEANSTDLDTPLKHTNLYEIAPVTVTAPPSLKLDVTNVGANFIATRTYDIPDMDAAEAQASIKALGLQKDNLDVNSLEFKSKPKEEQDLLISRNKAQSASGKREPVESAKHISEVLQDQKYADPKFRNSDGTLNIDAVIKDNGNNELVSGVLSSIKQYNEKMDEMANQIKAGYFQDKLGKTLSFGAGGLNENKYRKIDLSDGLSPAELLKVRIVGLAKPIDYTTKVDQTNEAIAKQNANTQSGQLQESIRANKAREYQNSKEFEATEARFKATQVGGKTQINGAMERAKRLYSEMLEIADKNGVIPPSEIRKLNVEQLKYLGIEQPQERNETGDIINQGGFKPLDLSGAKYGIQLVKGKINVFGPKKNEKGEVIEELRILPDGRLVGQLDNTKSTTMFNMGTNILNEELAKAGSNEVNTYMGVDVTGGITTNTDGGSTTVSGATQNKTQTTNPDAGLSDAQYFLKYKKARTK